MTDHEVIGQFLFYKTQSLLKQFILCMNMNKCVYVHFLSTFLNLLRNLALITLLSQKYYFFPL